MNQNVNAEELHLKDYIWIIYKRRWAALSFFILVVAAVMVYTITRVPLYEAGTRVLIEKENPNIMDFKELYSIDSTKEDFYQTQYEIIKSRMVGGQVVDRLRMVDDASSPSGGGGLMDRLMFWREERDGSERERLIRGVLKNLTVEPIRNTRLADVRFMSPNPETAATIANTIVEVYIDQTLSSKIETVKGATEFLTQKIEEQRQKLEESELQLQRYKEQYNIISLTEKENITVSKLAELNSEVIAVENERVEAETRYLQAKAIMNQPDMIESIPKVLNNTFITSLKTEEANLQKELSEQLKKYGEKHPRIIALREKIRATRDKLNAEIQKVVTFLKNEYEVALARESTLKRALEDQKGESQRLNKLAINYGVLQREVDTNKQMYDILLTRLKEAGISSGIQSTNVRVVDYALAPMSPVSPNIRLNLMLALVAGLMGGIGVGFFLEYLDNTVKTPSDLQGFLQLPYLGPVPSYKSELGDDAYERALVTLNHPKSTSAESYRGIRTAITFSSSMEASKKTLLVTSSGPSEGKSLTSANLAIVMAQSGARTILVDCDFRKPRVHKIFGISRDVGLTNHLVAGVDLGAAIVRTKIPNLDILPAGIVPPNPSELIGSEGMRRVIEKLGSVYGKVIIDSPPISAVTDSVILSTMISEVMIVIHAGKFSRDFIRRSVDQLRDVGANIIGGILNNIKVGQESYYYYQYYYYYDDKATSSGGLGGLFKFGQSRKMKSPGSTDSEA